MFSTSKSYFKEHAQQYTQSASLYKQDLSEWCFSLWWRMSKACFPATAKPEAWAKWLSSAEDHHQQPFIVSFFKLKPNTFLLLIQSLLSKTFYLSLWCCGIACFCQCGSQGVHICISDNALPELLFCLPPPPPLFSLEVTNLPVVVVCQFFSWCFSVLCNITFASCFLQLLSIWSSAFHFQQFETVIAYDSERHSEHLHQRVCYSYGSISSRQNCNCYLSDINVYS